MPEAFETENCPRSYRFTLVKGELDGVYLFSLNVAKIVKYKSVRRIFHWGLGRRAEVAFLGEGSNPLPTS